MGLTQRELCPDADISRGALSPAVLPVTSSTNALSLADRSGEIAVKQADVDQAEETGKLCWFALGVKHQHERTVERALTGQKWHALAPVYRAKRTWSDRVKEVELPLFAGYVFCRFDYRERVRILNTPGVRRIVGFGSAAVPVEDAEIEAIERMDRSGAAVRPWPYLKPGDRVRVERGPLRGLTGTLIRERDVSRLVIGVEMLQRSVAVEMDPSMVTPIEEKVKVAAAGA